MDEHLPDCRTPRFASEGYPKLRDERCPPCRAELAAMQAADEAAAVAKEAAQEHASLRTRFALALAAGVALMPGVASDMPVVVRGIYEIAGALAREDARRRAEDAK